MPHLGLRPDSYTYYTMIKHLGRQHMPSALSAVLESLRAQDMPVGEQVAQVLVESFGRLGDLDGMDRAADLLQNELRTPLTTGCYERILIACGRQRDLARIKLYKRRFDDASPPLTPSGGLCAALVTGLSRCGEYDAAVRAFDDFSRQGLPPDARALRALIQSHLVHGHLTRAQHVLADLCALFPRHVISAQCSEAVARRVRAKGRDDGAEVDVLRQAGIFVGGSEEEIEDADVSAGGEEVTVRVYKERAAVHAFQALR